MALRVERIGLVGQDACIRHVAQREDLLLARSDREDRSIDHWADQSFDAIARQRKHCFENRVIVIEYDAAYGRDSLQEQRTVMNREIARPFESRTEPIYPNRFDRVYDDIERSSVCEKGEQGCSKSRHVGRLPQLLTVGGRYHSRAPP